MADFNKAFIITLGHEGGYSNDPDDAGGETYRGIARRYHPDWSGWALIDENKQNIKFLSEPDFPGNLPYDYALNTLVEEFYKTNYWNLFWADEIPNQAIANELFDTSVNMGISRAVKFLQTGLNVLNRNQKNYPDIVEDGKFGPNTLKTLRSYLKKDKPSYLLKVMNILQGEHYLTYMRKSPIQERFARGWLSRVSITKEF